MKILYVCQQPSHENGGAEVVDRKLQAGLVGLGHQVDSYRPQPVSRPREAINLSLRGLPYYRARFESSQTRRELRERSRDYDAVVVSWEPFDGLALESTRPVLVLLHNITSSAIRSVFPDSRIASLFALRCELWERKVYGDRRLAALATLSVAEQRYVAGLSRGTPVVYAPPGMPPSIELADDARFVPEIMISATHGWYPKRRDAVAFAEEYAAAAPHLRLPVLVDELPERAKPLLQARDLASADMRREIRFGLITDRFESGHKLKTTYYLAHNAIVLSYADVSRDFEQIPDHAFFIRRVDGMASVARHVAEVAAVDPAELRARLRAFKQRCQERFDWQRSAKVLSDTLETVTR